MKTDHAFAVRLLDVAKQKGADLAEVYVKATKRLSVEVKDQAVDALESSRTSSYALRIIKGGRLGFSYSADPRDLETVAEQAIEAARWTGDDTYLDLPAPCPAGPTEIFDPAVDAIRDEEAIAGAMGIEEAARDVDSRIRKVRKAGASFSTRSVLIVNSRGVDVEYGATGAAGDITVVAEDGDERQTGWDYEGSRFLGDVSFGAIGRRAAQRALRMLGARTISSEKTDVILDNTVAVEFLGVLSSLLSSENVQKGKSLLAGRLYQEIASPHVTVCDDGTLPRKLGSRPFDDEGVATSRKDLIKDGVLRGYLYNTYTARKEGVRSTGNAVKGTVASLPGVGPSNFFLSISPECIYQGDLVSVIDRGLFITDAMGIHTANPVSGEFSIGVSGLWVEHGAVVHPVKEAVVSGNILELFGNIEAAGDDFRFYGNTASPSLVIRSVDIGA